MPVFVGLDCGGSSCRALARDDSGAEVFRGQSGPANLLSTPPDVLARNLEAASAGCPEPDSVCGCFAGLVGDAERQRALKLLRSLFPAARLRAEPDYLAAVRLSDGADACVIAGTGSVVVSWVEGRAVKSGGRGLLLGDEGSASQIGRRALRLYLDGGAPELVPAIRESFLSDEETEVISELLSSGSMAAKLARLAPAVGKLATDGSKLMAEVVRPEMAALAEVLNHHLSKIGNEAPSRLALAGGLWKAAPAFQAAFEAAIRARLGTEIEIVRITQPPVEGAFLLAQEALDGN